MPNFGVAINTRIVSGAAIVGSESDHQGDKHLYVPILGPWLDLADRGGCDNITNTNCDGETTNKVLLVADGVIQAAGAIEIVAGLLTPTHHHGYVRTAKVQVRPRSLGHGNPGLVVFGQF